MIEFQLIILSQIEIWVKTLFAHCYLMFFCSNFHVLGTFQTSFLWHIARQLFHRIRTQFCFLNTVAIYFVVYWVQPIRSRIFALDTESWNSNQEFELTRTILELFYTASVCMSYHVEKKTQLSSVVRSIWAWKTLIGSVKVWWNNFFFRCQALLFIFSQKAVHGAMHIYSVNRVAKKSEVLWWPHCHFLRSISLMDPNLTLLVFFIGILWQRPGAILR